jgi:uncharacterized protein
MHNEPIYSAGKNRSRPLAFSSTNRQNSLEYAYILIALLAVLAGTVGGVIGFGSSIILMPILVWVFGAKQAVPIMAVAALFANGSRVWIWWRAISWPPVFYYCLAGMPAAALGARTFVELSPKLVEAVLGIVIILMIPGRRWLAARNWNLKAWHLAFPGIGIGYLSGLMVSTGPINTPFFLSHGLVKGPFIGTEAVASLLVFASKAVVLRNFELLPSDAIIKGVLVGIALNVGAFISKRIVEKIKVDQFKLLMDAVLLFAGLSMLAAIFFDR